MQLVGIRKGLQQEVEDLGEALRGETDARVAATEELGARLQAREQAEAEREEAVAKYLRVEQQYLEKVEESARVREEANAEVRLWHNATAALCTTRAFMVRARMRRACW